MLFRQVYGMSARQYRSLVKLKRAKTLLLDNEMSVQSVAERMGYSDTAHFSRQFKRWTGMSPIAYRSNTGIAGKAEANIPQDFAMPAV
jgi:AraC-like DNA-binding protein